MSEEPPASPPSTPAPSASAPRRRFREWFIAGIVWVIAFDVAFLWQRMAGANISEFGGHVEEPAHFVNGLMVRDYIAGGFSGDPTLFRDKYRAHYPNATLGSRPPAFDLVQGSWMLLFGSGRMSAMLLMAALAGVLAVVLFRALKEQAGLPLAIVGTLLLIGLPLVREYYTVIMPDLLGAIFLFAAASAFGRYLDEERTRDSIAFGLFAGLAITTMGSGIVSALVVPLAIIIAGKLRVLVRPAFWGGIALAALIGGPWLWFARSQASPTQRPAGDAEMAASAIEAATFYFGRLGFALGIALAVLLCIGVIVRLTRRTESRGRSAAYTAVILSIVGYHCVVSKELEERHVIAALPAAIFFAVAGAVAVQGWFGQRSKAALQSARPIGAILLLLLSFAAVEVAAQSLGGTGRKQWSGFGKLAEEIVQEDPSAKRTVMIASDAIGEGIFISELAVREQRPGHVVKLASRELTRSSRYSRDVTPRFEAAEDVATWFAKAGIDYLVVDESIPPSERDRHYEILIKAVDTHMERFSSMANSSIVREGAAHPGQASLYRVKHVE